MSASMESFIPLEDTSNSSDDTGTNLDVLMTDDADIEGRNRFLCKYCDSPSLFKERRHLDVHILKNHTSICIGCYDVFGSKEGMLKHLQVEEHEKPSFCRQCRGVFLDDDDKEGHDCEHESAAIGDNPVSISGECVASVDDDVKICAKNECKVSEKMEPRSENDLSASFYSREKESNDKSEPDQWLAECELSCIHCIAEDFKSQHDLRVHTYKTHSSVCVVCFEGFDDDASRQRHQKARRHSVWNCVICDEIFVSQSVYQTHVTVSHPDNCPYKCLDCDVKGLSEYEIVSHRRVVHDDITYFSRTCLQSRELNWEMLQNTCSVCLESFTTSYSLLLHMFKVHNKPGQTHSYKCESCQLGFGRGKAFENHVRKCHGNDKDHLNQMKSVLASSVAKSSHCDICDIPCSSISYLHQHMVVEHPEWRPYECNICGARYPEKSDVQLHVRSDHCVPRCLVCPLCDFTHREKGSFESHLKIHHGYQGMPYIYCFTHKKGFLYMSSFQNHAHFHHLDRKNRPLPPSVPKMGFFPCRICGRGFTIPSNLKLHLIKDNCHSGDRIVKCGECGLSFKNIHGLNNHRRKHTFKNQSRLDRRQTYLSGHKHFRCELCDIRFSQKSSLRRHMGVVHSIGELSNSMKLRLKQGSQHEDGMNKKTVMEKRSNGVEKSSTQDQEMRTNDKIENSHISRKRRRDSSIPTGSTQETIPLKEICIRPSKREPGGDQ